MAATCKSPVKISWDSGFPCILFQPLIEWYVLQVTHSAAQDAFAIIRRMANVSSLEHYEEELRHLIPLIFQHDLRTAYPSVSEIAIMLADDQRPQVMKEAACAVLIRIFYRSDNPMLIVSALVPRLASLLQEPADAELTTISAMVLYLLTDDKDNKWRQSLADGALAALCDLLQSAPAVSCRFHAAASALKGIAVLPAMRIRIWSLSGPRLLSLLQDSAQPICVEGVAGLFRQLTESSDVCMSIADTAMPQLCSGLQAIDSKSRELAAVYLKHLTRHAPIRRQVKEASLTSLIALIQDQTVPECRKAAACTLHALADIAQGGDELRIEIADAALSTLVSFLKEGSEGSDRAAGLIASLACCPALKARIHSAALPGLVTLLQATACPEGRSHAACAIGNIALDAALRQGLVETALPALVSLLTDLSALEGRVKAARNWHHSLLRRAPGSSGWRCSFNRPCGFSAL